MCSLPGLPIGGRMYHGSSRSGIIGVDHDSSVGCHAQWFSDKEADGTVSVRPEPNRRYTIDERDQWEGRWELVDGIPYALAAPTDAHQEASTGLLTEIRNKLRRIDHPCRVVGAPLDLACPGIAVSDDDLYNVVQPDLMILCNPVENTSKIKETPKWIAEILSPSSWRVDRNRKLNQYERARISEYWIIDILGPNVRVEVYRLQNDKYELALHGSTDTIPLLNGAIEIDLAEVFSGLPSNRGS